SASNDSAVITGNDSAVISRNEPDRDDLRGLSVRQASNFWRGCEMKLRYSALYVAMTAVLFSSAAVHAAETDATTSTQAPSTKVKNLATVQVTATKRETPLQKTPVAITAFGGDTLDKERVMTVQDLTKLVPGLQGTSEGDHGVVTLTLRGIGNDSAKTEYADPEVATFVDGVYTPRAEAAASLLLDMDSVEVLRGPQGTLWGRNSTAGAISFTTIKPDINGGFNGSGTIEMGNYNQSGVRAAVNLPISSTFAMRIAAVHEQHDGYVDYQNPVGQIPTLAQQQANYLASGGDPASFQPINTNLFVQKGKKHDEHEPDSAAAAGPGVLVGADRRGALPGSHLQVGAQPHGLDHQRQHGTDLRGRLQPLFGPERFRPGRRRERADQLHHQRRVPGRPHQLLQLRQFQPRVRPQVPRREHGGLDPRRVLRAREQRHPLRHPDHERYPARHRELA